MLVTKQGALRLCMDCLLTVRIYHTCCSRPNLREHFPLFYSFSEIGYHPVFKTKRYND